jgi:hypothetical protein
MIQKMSIDVITSGSLCRKTTLGYGKEIASINQNNNQAPTRNKNLWLKNNSSHLTVWCHR